MKFARNILILTTISLTTAHAGESNLGKQAPPPTPLDDRWRFSLASPGWMAGLEGDVGIDGVISAIDVSPDTIIRSIDMAASLRGEASKGRFGVMADFLYLSLSDGLGTERVVKKADVQVDQVLGELALRWRLIDTPRGSLDVYGGVRYTNLFQQVVTQANAERIDEVSTALVDTVSERLRTALSDSGLRDLVRDRVATAVSGGVPTFDPSQPSTLPIGPLGGRVADALQVRIAAIVEAKRAELSAAVGERARAVAAEAGARAQRRIDAIKSDLSKKIARTLQSKLDTRIARVDDWWDPFIGLRGRLNLNEAWYLTAKGDIGGFGVGSEFAWQAEAALGCQVTKSIFAEAGYRALGTDYNQDGLTYGVITHGAQVTVGITF